MNKEDLKPFDWDEYRVGDDVYWFEFGRGFRHVLNDDLRRCETRGGEIYYEGSEGFRYLESELKLPKNQNHDCFINKTV